MSEIAVIQPEGTALQPFVARDPESVLGEAQKAARALKDVIARKSKPVIFNGEQYLEFEDWQTVGRFYGLACRTLDAVPFDAGGIPGAKAEAEVLDTNTGQVIGHAVSYCLRDEHNWAQKPWFQLASMAQTRAGAKALRNLLSWVVVLAGYKPTPAEEMTGIFDKSKNEETKPPEEISVSIQDVKKFADGTFQILDANGSTFKTDEHTATAAKEQKGHTITLHYEKRNGVRYLFLPAK